MKPIQKGSTMNTHTKQPRQPRTTHEGGKTIILVPLAGGHASAKLFPEDFEAITAAGYSDQWRLDSNGHGSAYVRARRKDPASKAAAIAIARLIMRPERGEKVCYLDGNRLNLRRDNLTLERGARLAKADKRGSRGESLEKFVERMSHRP